MKTDEIPDHLDARDLLCPLPVLRIRKRLQAMPKGALLEVVATDAGAWDDIPAFCRQTGDILEDQIRQTDQMVFRIRKG